MSDMPRVLLVDDQDDARALMRQFLKREHVIVEEAVDGSDALERVRAGHFDLVLMDVHMPGMDGLSATRSIRTHESESGRSRTVILALTADDSEADRQASIAAGCAWPLCQRPERLRPREKTAPPSDAPARADGPLIITTNHAASSRVWMPSRPPSAQ